MDFPACDRDSSVIQFKWIAFIFFDTCPFGKPGIQISVKVRRHIRHIAGCRGDRCRPVFRCPGQDRMKTSDRPAAFIYVPDNYASFRLHRCRIPVRNIDEVR